MIECQCAFVKTKAQEISIFPTHNLEVPGYLLRLWFAPTSLITNPQSMGLYETNLKPRLVHIKRIAPNGGSFLLYWA